ncbi:MAG: folate family ECF transporter S component [Clostridia bacterium]|nr:folate family ECF transporter S component [Clostridia bacterium]
MQNKKTLSVRAIVFIGVFAALDIVLTRPFRTLGAPFNFGFVAIATAGTFFGPVYGAFTALVSDILGYLLFPQTKPYFPGYAITAVSRALVYALLFYRNPVMHLSKDTKLFAWCKAVALCVIASGLNIAINLFTLPLWQVITSGTYQSYWFFVLKRIPNSLLFWGIQIVTLPLLMRYLAPLREKYAPESIRLRKV